MVDALAVSSLLLWFVVLTLLVVVFALSRQIGILHERIAPMGALMMDAGPAVGDAAPRLDINDLDGTPVSVAGDLGGRGLLIFFVSPGCPVCKKLLPIVRSVHQRERAWLDLVLASDGPELDHRAFRREHQLGAYPYVLSTELGMAYRVSKLPYAVMLDGTGRVRAKGLVNSREQVESLFTAGELGVASVQEYLAQTHASGAAAGSSSGARADAAGH